MTLKKRTILFSFIVMCIILASGTIASAAPGGGGGGGGQKYYVNGYVKTSSGAPISGAKVMLYKDGSYLSTAYTSSNGYFSGSTYSYVVIRSWKAVVSKSGYVTNTKTVSASAGSTTSMGTIYLTSSAPPPIIDPVIGSPSVSFPSPITTQITVSVTWHYDPYDSRSVYLEINGDSQIMQPMGGDQYYKTLIGGEYRTSFSYSIRAVEKWYEGEPPVLKTADAITGNYNSGNNPWTESIRHLLIGSQGAGTNYQLQFVVHYGSGSNSLGDVYCDSLCQTYFDDIRFVSDDELTVYDYWIESITPGDSAVFWVEIQDNLDYDVAIRMYYGNANAESSSDGFATFAFFDDFSGSSLNLAKWDITEYGAGTESHYYQVSGGELFVHAESNSITSGYRFDSDDTFNLQNYHIHTEGRWANLDYVRGSGDFQSLRLVDADNQDTALNVRLRGDYKTVIYRILDGTHSQVSNPYDYTSGEAIFDYYIDGTSFDLQLSGTYSYTHSGTVSGFHNPYYLSLCAYIDYWTYPVEVDTYYDLIYMRSYIENEPAHGNWESTDTVFIDDCSTISGWARNVDYGTKDLPYTQWPYPLDTPTMGSIRSDGNTFYTYSIDIDSSKTVYGPAYHKSISNPFMLQSLSDFHVSLERISFDIGEHGSFHISINDIGMRPIVDVQVYDYDVDSDRIVVNVTYVDEKLKKYTTEIASVITTSWSGEFDIWYEKDVGIVASLDGSAPITIADMTVVNKYRSIAYVSMQSTRYESDPIPNFKVDEITLETYTFELELDLNRASYLRSGPTTLPLTQPGPTNEIQIFPSYSKPLTFQFETDHIWNTHYITIDAIPISYSGSTDSSIIDIRVNDILIDSFVLNWDPTGYLDPFTGIETQRYTCDFNFIPGTEVNTIELLTHGTSWDPMDIVALRGIWVRYNSITSFEVDVKQIIPDTCELTYFVPMGSYTILYFAFEGADGSYVDIFVDGIYKDTHADPGISNTVSIDLGDFIRGTFHELTVVYHETISGMSPAIVTMHTSFHWLTVEIDYFEYPPAYNASNGVERHFPADIEGGIWTSFSEYLNDVWTDIVAYYAAHTHGRLLYTIGDGIPWDQAQEHGDGYLDSDLAIIAQQRFDHWGDRDYLWVIYGDHLVVEIDRVKYDVAGYRFDSGAISLNGWERWSAIAIQWHQTRSATMHELGHATHITGDADTCFCPGCVMPYNSVVGEIMCFCQYHWYQTCYNRVGEEYMWISEWWLL